MNVNDVQDEAREEGDMLDLIFAKQKGLMQKYHEIEEKQGVGYGLIAGQTFSINEIKSQCLLKDFAWRFTEEVTEATACNLAYDMEQQHFLEELADALHFLTELCIVASVDPEYIMDGVFIKDDQFDSLFYTPDESVSRDPYWPIQHLGLAMNCLKQKPWKVTHILTDEKKFRIHLRDAYRSFCKYMSCFATAEEMYDYYFKKNKVNQFRQESNY